MALGRIAGVRMTTGLGLIRIDLQTGARDTFEGWDSVSWLAPAAEGWIVTGRRRGQARGVYRLPSSGEPELLIADSNVTGIGIREDRLAILTDLRLPETSIEGSTLLVYETPLPVARALGPLCAPLTAKSLSEIASTVLEKAEEGWPFRSGDEIRECAGRARRLVRDQSGRDFPRVDAELDRYISEIHAQRVDLSAAGELLLGVLFAAHFLDQGATWVAGQPPIRFWQPHIVSIDSTPTAAAYSPASVIASTLHDDLGYWRPVSSIKERLRGRKLYMGIDRDSLVRALTNEPSPDLLLLSKPERTLELLEAVRSVPENDYLREQVYRLLVRRGDYETLENLSQEFARRENAILVDRKAWFLARAKTVVGAEEQGMLIEELKKTIEKNPRSESLYYALGVAYESRGDSRRGDRCYRRVLELSPPRDLEALVREKLRESEFSE